MNTKFKEIEFKYDANNIKLEEFISFCRKRKPTKELMAAGNDHFYASRNDKSAFYRYRQGSGLNQLTFKRKLDDNNNFVRIEHNIDLANNMTEDAIEQFCLSQGYEYNTTLYKNCVIFQYGFHTLVYYICYDANMIELGRFIEIEMNEEHEWRNIDHATTELLMIERICKPLGLNVKNRVLESLFEMFKKDLTKSK